MLRDKMLIGTMLFILVISPTVAMAKDMRDGRGMPPGKWWHNPQMSKELNLSEPERTKLDEEFRNSRRKLIELRSTVERERFELENLLELQALNEAAVMEQFKKLEKARASLAAERFSFLLQVRKTLGPERFQRLKTYYRQFRQHRMRRNMDGPGPRN
jgi:Spy/CpxP family protein refolding chaperone